MKNIFTKRKIFFIGEVKRNLRFGKQWLAAVFPGAGVKQNSGGARFDIFSFCRPAVDAKCRSLWPPG
jgi:hypothetical protein